MELCLNLYFSIELIFKIFGLLGFRVKEGFEFPASMAEVATQGGVLGLHRHPPLL